MKRPKTTIVHGPDIRGGECDGTPQWHVMNENKIVDTYVTREEAREFKRYFDPKGFYCLHCDESAKEKELPLQWTCKFCGKLNDWEREMKNPGATDMEYILASRKPNGRAKHTKCVDPKRA